MNKRNTDSGKGSSGRKYTGRKDSFRSDNDRRDSDRDQKSDRKDYGSRKPERGSNKRDDDKGDKRPYTRRESPAEKKSYSRDDKPERRSRDGESKRPYSREEKPERRSREGENKRLYSREEKPERRSRDGESKRPYSRDDKPERRERGGEERRSFDRRERTDRNDRGGEKRPFRENRSEFKPRDSKYSGPKRRDSGGDNADDRRGSDYPKRRESSSRDGDEKGSRPFGSRGRSDGNRRDFGDKRSFSPGKKDFDRKGRTSFDKPDKKFNTEGDEKRRPKTKKFNKKDQELIGNWRDERPTGEKTGHESFDTSKTRTITGEVRLNKYLANSGLCSRRDADEFIENGSVSVNGEVVKELGVKVKPTDEVRFKGRLILPEKPVYILMNKPKDCITSADDPDGRRTVLDLLDESIEERVFPVGRLDRNTTGVILITNDGDLAQKLTHPSYGVHKVYKAELDKPLSMEDMEKLAAGLELEDGFIQPDEIAYIDDTRQLIGLEIHSGKNHIVHRMFNQLGYLVDKLDRVSFAGLTKDRIKRGEYRMLTEKEVLGLRRASGKKKE